MSASSGRRGFVVVAVAVVLAMAGALTGQAPALARREPGRPPPHQGAPAPGSEQGQDLYGCDRTFGHQPEGHLVKHTTPGGGQAVHRGDSVVVVITWQPGDWSANRLHKVLDCVAVDGQLDPSLQSGESPTDNDGRFTTRFTVPADVPDGAQICDQAMLSGPSPRGDYDRQISNQVCHTVSGGGDSCHRGCAQRPCDRCGDEAPPCSGGCAQPPPCQRCAERPPCDRGCGHDGCGDEGGSCDAGRASRDDGGRRKDCRCDDGHRRGLVGRLIEKLV